MFIGSLEENLKSLTLYAEIFRLPNFIYVDRNTSSYLLTVVNYTFI